MPSREQEQDDQNRWHARPVLAALLKLAVISIPIVCSLAAAWVASALLPPSAGGARWAFRAVVVVAALGAAMLAERGARRLLPMTTLLKLSLLFPDQAPSRFKVARKATSRQKLDQLAGKRDDTASGMAASILSLLAALASHDKRTRGHAERVRVYADLLAQQLRLNREEQDLLRWGSLLHDIGKLTVDPEILNKAGKPTDQEWTILRAHPEEGARAAASLLGWLGEWGRAIAEHHERFDGTGYPAGLSGSAISRAGRMIAVVDAYEVMTAARSYKRPVSTQKAREELTRCAGTHFDPVTVRAFLAISLPRLLWATGPLSFFVQLPFVGALKDAAATIASAGGPAVAAAAGAVVVVAAGPSAAPQTHATLSATPQTPIHALESTRPAATPPPFVTRPHASPTSASPAPAGSLPVPTPVSTPAPPPVPPPLSTPVPTPVSTPVIDARIDARTDARTDACTNSRTDARTDSPRDGWSGGVDVGDVCVGVVHGVGSGGVGDVQPGRRRGDVVRQSLDRVGVGAGRAHGRGRRVECRWFGVGFVHLDGGGATSGRPGGGGHQRSRVVEERVGVVHGVGSGGDRDLQSRWGARFAMFEPVVGVGAVAGRPQPGGLRDECLGYRVDLRQLDDGERRTRGHHHVRTGQLQLRHQCHGVVHGVGFGGDDDVQPRRRRGGGVYEPLVGQRPGARLARPDRDGDERQ